MHIIYGNDVGDADETHKYPDFNHDVKSEQSADMNNERLHAPSFGKGVSPILPFKYHA